MSPLLLLALAAPSPTDAARDVLLRTFPDLKGRLELAILKDDSPLDVFETEIRDGKLIVRGDTPVAICRGAYETLKDAAKVSVSWNTETPPLPKTLPDRPLRRVRTPNRFRHYFNVCTFGYSTVWWDWKRWQREIDWMALHGINMPLAMNGVEKVWRDVFRSYGVPDASIKAFFSGPAFLPWHRMGNLNAHMGPLPDSWIDGQARLQRQILARERSLGMTPVVPGFSGFVPVDFDKFVPGVRLDSPTAWGGFAPTRFIDVRDPKFVEVGRRFIEAYRKEFGSDHYYLCDTFNEQNPQFPEATKLRDLASAGRAVYDAIRQGDPEGVWVMQGWLFYNEAGYWGKPEVDAMLSAVPEGKMVVLDLAVERFEGWRKHEAIRKTGYIRNVLHNFGQSTEIGGRLDGIRNALDAVYTTKDRGRDLGMGLTMEGIDQNPIVYEYATDAMWVDRPIPFDRWVDDYLAARYGRRIPAVTTAWREFIHVVYERENGWGGRQWRNRPRDGGPEADLPRLAASEKLIDALLASGVENDAFRRDLVDITKTWLGEQLNLYLSIAMFPEAVRRTIFVQLAQDMLVDLDRLLACRREHRLSTWISHARRWGRTPAERDLMERNARMQVTRWGGTDGLADYAIKEWAGLTRSFISARWDRALRDEKTDWSDWETAWAKQIGGIRESTPGDAVAVARELRDKYRNTIRDPMLLMQYAGVNLGIAVGCPVTDSGHTEPGGESAWVTDGRINGRFWAANPAPQWVQIDLRSVQPVRQLAIYPYAGDDRRYRYRVDVSIDGTAWANVVPETEATATPRGYRHIFDPTPARYVRVTMLANSANPAVHLHEVQVFK